MSLGLWSVDGWPVQLLGLAVSVVVLGAEGWPVVQIIQAAGRPPPGRWCRCRQGGRWPSVPICGVLSVPCPSVRVSPSPPLLLPSWGVLGVAWGADAGRWAVQVMRGVLSVNMHKLSPKKAAL